MIQSHLVHDGCAIVATFSEELKCKTQNKNHRSYFGENHLADCLALSSIDMLVKNGGFGLLGGAEEISDHEARRVQCYWK